MRIPAATTAALILSTLTATLVLTTPVNADPPLLIYPKPHNSYQTQSHGAVTGDRTKEGYILGHGYFPGLRPDGSNANAPDYNRNGMVGGYSSKSPKAAKGAEGTADTADAGIVTRTGDGESTKSPKAA